MSLSRKQTFGQRFSGGCGSPAGFTLAEVLAAMLFMAIVIPVAMEGLRIASRAGSVAGRKSVAVQLADSKLNELIAMSQWRNTSQGGIFGDQWPGYRWTMKNELWSEGAMRLITVEVTYPAQNQNYSVQLSTLAQDTIQ
jgi:type II secretory pathway pseudopilin PulG